MYPKRGLAFLRISMLYIATLFSRFDSRKNVCLTQICWPVKCEYAFAMSEYTHSINVNILFDSSDDWTICSIFYGLLSRAHFTNFSSSLDK